MKKTLTITLLIFALLVAVAFVRPVSAAGSCASENCADSCEGNCEGNCTTDCCPAQLTKAGSETTCYPSLESALAASSNGDTVKLLTTISLNKMLDIKNEGVILDLNNQTITASGDFVNSDKNSSHIINISANNVTIKNGSIVATNKSRHGINVFHATGVTLKNITIDHSNAGSGAPLVVNGSSVKVEGNLNLIVGNNSWYGVNVDPKDNTQASLTFEKGSSVKMSGNDKLKAIVIENDGTDGKTSAVSGAEEAGLAIDANGNYVVEKKVPTPETPAVSTEVENQEKDSTPKTGKINLGLVSIISILSFAGIVAVKKYNK